MHEIAGWTIAVVRAEGSSGTTICELWDCAIKDYREAEAEVVNRYKDVNVLQIKGDGALSREGVHALHLLWGDVQKRAMKQDAISSDH
jgi:hypothetical protein